MRKDYDFSKATRNPYAKRVKKRLTIRVDETTIEYFKKLAGDMNVPYQTLINLYLRDCAASRRRLSLKWEPTAKVTRELANQAL
jgi:predicted DNA binding CopG/RHH family protein